MTKKMILWAVLLAGVLGLLLPVFPAVCIEDAKSDLLLAAFPAPESQAFHIAFKHSVNRTEVREYYVVHQETLILARAEYSSFGAGMPEVPEKSGSVLESREGVLQLNGINQPMESFIYRVGTIANHTLVRDGSAVPLKTIAPPQTALRFSYRRIPAIVLLRRHV